MPKINIIVREKIAQAVGDTHIVCGNSDYIAVFDFDAEWDAYETKTARFIWNGKCTDVVFVGSECPVPVILDAFGVLVGVYAGDLHTTTAATVDTEKSILCRNGLPADPPPDVYAQIIAQLNGMASPEWKDIQDKPFAALGDGLSVDKENKLSVSGKIDAPQVAQVGEVLTVEEIGEDGKPKKWKTAPAAAEQKQADWNQNDETAADYVKNRPFYNEEIPYTIIAQATVPATSGRVLFGNINETYAKALNDSLFQNNVNVIVVNGVKIAAQYTGSTSWYQYYDTAIFKGGDIDECRVSKQKNVIQLTMNDASNVTFEVGTEYTITFMNTTQSSYTYHPIGADYVPIGSGLNVNNGKIVSTVGQKYLEGMSEDAGDVFNNISDNIASGKYSHAEGYAVTASGDWGSHAEGYRTIASNRSAHAEGGGSTASGENSHAEGNGSTASGAGSHAEGYETVARYMDSHAEGRYTITSCYQQHVQGRSNIEDTKGVLAHIVGNGTSDKERSNAHTLDWNGNAWFSGNVYVGSTSGKNADDGSKKLATVEELESSRNEIFNELDNQVYPIIGDGSGITINSSTQGSTKKFKITVDDSGALSATEVTEETVE